MAKDEGGRAQKAGSSRRSFLKTLGLAGAGTATVATVHTANGREEPEEQIKGRYHLSEHVKRFYSLNRL